MRNKEKDMKEKKDKSAVYNGVEAKGKLRKISSPKSAA